VPARGRRGAVLKMKSGPGGAKLRIVSGGQSGVDRAALDVALERGLPCGGWCPKGRLAEDGEIDPRYPLAETPSSENAQRTEWNVRDSDGTLILSSGRLSGGTLLTSRLAGSYGKPCLIVDLAGEPDPGAVRAWMAKHRIGTLNVAGPRESKRPGVYGRAADFLRRVTGIP
jgi:hypothetical protein